MKLTVTKKQVCFILFTIIPASKFLVLPTVYAYFAKQDTWIAGLINCLLDGVLLAIMLLLIKKFDGRTLFDVLSQTFNKTTAKIIFFIYFLYFMLKAIVPVFEQKMFTEITLYETSPTVLTFLPFFALSFYFCLKGMNAMARSGEVIFWFTLFGLSLVLFLSIGTTDPYYLLPILKNPVNQTLNASYSGLIWYGQPIILLFLMGRIKKEKRFYSSIITTCAIAFAICIATYIIFIGIYGNIAVRQIYALTKMTKYAISLSNVGRFDYLTSLLLTVSSTLSLSVPLVFASDCLKHVFTKVKPWVTALIINGALLLVTAIFELKFQSVLDFFEKYFTPVMFFLVYVLPLALFFIKRRKTDARIPKK